MTRRDMLIARGVGAMFAVMALVGCKTQGTCITIDKSDAAYNADFCWVDHFESLCTPNEVRDEQVYFYEEDATHGMTRCLRHGFRSDASPADMERAISQDRPVAFTRPRHAQPKSSSRAHP